jgi:type IV pilus assembly protein PilW
MQTRFPFTPHLPVAPSGTRFSNKGFSLVEIMVALVIGLIALLVIMQVAVFAEGQKRTTTGAGDAQNNGALAMYSVQRDIKQAGHGFNSLSVIGCPLNRPTPPSFTLGALAPITINPPAAQVPTGDANTDTLLIVYGSSEGSPEGDTINGFGISGVSEESPEGDKLVIGLMSAANFKTRVEGTQKVGEWFFAAPMIPEDDCALTLDRIMDVDPAASTVSVPKNLDIKEGQNLFGLGFTPRIVAYAIRGGHLTACDYMEKDCSNLANWRVVANDIVSLRAQYGRAGAWDQTTPGKTGNQKDFATELARISSVRLALVARNDKPEPGITTNVPTWAGSVASAAAPADPLADPPDPSDPPAASAAAPIVLSARADWQNFRYQVYETVIPIRNIPWMGI